jgi:hypothetical protein
MPSKENNNKIIIIIIMSIWLKFMIKYTYRSIEIEMKAFDLQK